ncbi:30S ribosomal protein S18, partial [Striga asiatica]
MDDSSGLELVKVRSGTRWGQRFAYQAVDGADYVGRGEAWVFEREIERPQPGRVGRAMVIVVKQQVPLYYRLVRAPELREWRFEERCKDLNSGLPIIDFHDLHTLRRRSKAFTGSLVRISTNTSSP